MVEQERWKSDTKGVLRGRVTDLLPLSHQTMGSAKFCTRVACPGYAQISRVGQSNTESNAKSRSRKVATPTLPGTSDIALGALQQPQLKLDE